MIDMLRDIGLLYEKVVIVISSIIMAIVILVPLLIFLKDLILDLRCRIFHRCEPQNWWENAPFGIGGGWDEYGIVCTQCDRIIKRISAQRYDELTEKLKKKEKNDEQR